MELKKTPEISEKSHKTTEKSEKIIPMKFHTLEGIEEIE